MEDKLETDSNRSYKEQRIREITFMYYSRPDIKKALYDFSKNRECIPRYFEGFGKRPDSFQYETDITEFVKRGATSFHCSEEIWKDPLEISTDQSKDELNSLKIGWDLLIDIDSPYLEYSKIYAELLIETLKFHGIKNIGVKFSGSKGFHIVVPWKSFPKEVYKQKTKDMFPEWPRIICEYLSEVIKKKLEISIYESQGDSIKELAIKTGKNVEDLLVRECKSCKRTAQKRSLITWYCNYCRTERIMPEKNNRVPKCPDCRKLFIEKSREGILYCDFCNINSKKNPEMFDTKERFATEKLIEADLILVAPRHLFRMPYSLHEKTALASIVIDKDNIKSFQLNDARPMKVEVKNFYPDSSGEEAKTLLLQALDWKEQKDKEEVTIQEQKNNLEIVSDSPKKSSTKGSYQKIIISNPTDEIYPPCIKLLMAGVKQDGRKRALFVLINFFKSLGVTDEDLKKKIFLWNEKNYMPLKKGYIESQLIWTKRNQSLMPPNCDKPNYKELGVCKPDELCRQIKNPINYATKKFFKIKK